MLLNAFMMQNTDYLLIDPLKSQKLIYLRMVSQFMRDLFVNSLVM